MQHQKHILALNNAPSIWTGISIKVNLLLLNSNSNKARGDLNTWPWGRKFSHGLYYLFAQLVPHQSFFENWEHRLKILWAHIITPLYLLIWIKFCNIGLTTIIWNQNLWKTMKNNEKQWKNHEKQWKTMKNNEKQWKTMKNNEKQWKTMKNNEKTMKNNVPFQKNRFCGFCTIRSRLLGCEKPEGAEGEKGMRAILSFGRRKTKME